MVPASMLLGVIGSIARGLDPFVLQTGVEGTPASSTAGALEHTVISRRVDDDRRDRVNRQGVDIGTSYSITHERPVCSTVGALVYPAGGSAIGSPHIHRGWRGRVNCQGGVGVFEEDIQGAPALSPVRAFVRLTFNPKTHVQGSTPVKLRLICGLRTDYLARIVNGPGDALESAEVADEPLAPQRSPERAKLFAAENRGARYRTLRSQDTTS